MSVSKNLSCERESVIDVPKDRFWKASKGIKSNSYIILC